MISLIVATYNRYKELNRLLNSLTPAKNLVQIIVVDQNDNLNLTPLINEFSDSGMDIVHLKCAEKNLSLARNFGVGYATKDLIAFPDDDCYYEPDTVPKVLDMLGKADSEIIIGNWVEKNNTTSPTMTEISKENIMSFNLGPICSITIFMKKEVLDRIEGFDPRLGVGKRFGAGEETDLIMRASKYGYHIKLCPQILIHHKYIQLGDKTYSNCWKEINRQRGVGALYIKHKLKFRYVLRGLASPLIKGFGFLNLKMVLIHFCIFYGRLTGMILWKFSYSGLLQIRRESNY
jgi:GT2 family glycosyltransferase